MRNLRKWLSVTALSVGLGLAGTSFAAPAADKGAEKPADKAADKVEKVALTPAQQEAVTKLQAKGALVMPVAADSDALVVSLQSAGKTAGDEELALVKQLPKVDQLDLRGTGVTDAGLANIEGLNSLTQLHLEKTGVTDEGLTHLKNLANLAYLNLYGTAVTDKGIANLSGLKNLKRLYLWQTKVTESGVASLKKGNAALYVNRGEELVVTTQPAEPAKAPGKPLGKKAAAAAAAEKPTTPAPKTAAPTPAATPLVVAAPAGAKAINTKCPVSGKDVDPEHVVVYDGKNVGLCCEKCQAKFEKDPKAFIDKVVADAK